VPFIELVNIFFPERQVKAIPVARSVTGIEYAVRIYASYGYGLWLVEFGIRHLFSEQILFE
jgi:hypothetical protein